MPVKAMNSANKRFGLNRSVLDIIDRMYPISAEYIFLEIEEENDWLLSRVEGRERLEQMCEHHILTKVTLPNDKVVYMMVST